jgi:hypothetical protein
MAGVMAGAREDVLAQGGNVFNGISSEGWEFGNPCRQRRRTGWT